MDNNLKELKEELSFLHFKKLFLLEFTRQLIKNSTHSEIIKLQTILNKEKGKEPEEEKSKISAELKKISEINKQEEETKGVRSIVHPVIGMFSSQNTPEVNLFENTFKKESKPEPIKKQHIPETFKPNYRNEQLNENIRRTSRGEYYVDPFRKLELWVPEQRLPEHIQYLKPTPIDKVIDLEKLNPLIKDPFVKTIECNGPGQNIVVKGSMGIKKTPIILSKEDIDSTIQRFSKETKIPVQEGVFKVVSGRLIFMAIISEVADTKFTINKISPEQKNQGK